MELDVNMKTFFSEWNIKQGQSRMREHLICSHVIEEIGKIIFHVKEFDNDSFRKVLPLAQKMNLRIEHFRS